jgi:MULE transposase domain/FAR1 DNA-binding domain/SWIM zinc finger
MDGDDPYIGFNEFSYSDDLIDERVQLDVVFEDEEAKSEGEGKGKIGEGQGDVGEIRPYVGMEFGTTDEAYNFYNAYAGHFGFSVRRNSFTKSKKGVSSIRFCCYKEGFSKRQIAKQNFLGSSTDQKTPEREYGSTRTGCKAYIRLRLMKTGIWQVTAFQEAHNHDLILSPSKNRNLRSQKEMQAEDKEVILDLSAQNVGTSQIMEYMAKKRGGKRKLHFKKKDVNNQIATHNRKIIGVDIETTLAYFRKRQEEDPEFFYAIDADENGTAQHVFWVDGRARRAYLEFGDVVTFDTTYNTNKYNMPLAPFIGCNHHRHSIFFGMALLRAEKVANFTWLFEIWLKAMYGKHPKAIITDQDPAMRIAIKNMFPNTIHRCCQWHVMRKAREQLLKVYNSKPSFEDHLKRVINRSLTVIEFEQCWATMLETHKVKDNNHLKVMFRSRAEWVPAYFRDTFFAEMSTTQRSESMNAILKLWLHSHTSIYQFVMKIENVIEGIWHRESDEDIKTMNETPRLWSKYHIEHEALEVYTRNSFFVFKEILVESTLGIVIQIEKDALYEVSIKTHPLIKNWIPESYMVDVDIDNENFSCNCKGFEFEGFLCQHALKVMQHLGCEHLPKKYIMKRWCKNANACAKKSVKERIEELGESEALRTFRRATIRPELRELEDMAVTSNNAFVFVKSIIDKAKNEVMPMVDMEALPSPFEIVEGEKNEQNKDKEQNKDHEQLYVDPLLSKCKGRKKRPARFIPTIENITKKRRTCSYCHTKQAHNIRTCPKVIKFHNISLFLLTFLYYLS